MVYSAASVFGDAVQRRLSHPGIERRWTYTSQTSSIEMTEDAFRKPDTEWQDQPQANNYNRPRPRRNISSWARPPPNMSSWSRNTGPLDNVNPFEPPANSILDPNSDNFDPKAWTKAVLALRAKDPSKFAVRTAGVAFRDLDAYGYGAPTGYQQTVGNVWLKVVNLFRKHMATGKRKIQILSGLDGIVEAGEMLVVLGPPGSGCTTFLKAISGETHGFNIDERSYLNYQGISIFHSENCKVS